MYFDIAANLSDSSYSEDLDFVIQRCNKFKVTHLLIAATTDKDARDALLVAKKSDTYWSTAGIHPCSSKKCLKDIDFKIEAIKSLILHNKEKVKFLGELGLDQDRLELSDKESQHIVFKRQLELLKDLKINHNLNLKMQLHSRNCEEDFIKYLKEYQQQSSGGVVHSFTGTETELNSILEMGQQIGINGCSLKTEENIELVKKIPLNKICIETDCPYCEIRKSSAAAKFLEDNEFTQVKQVKKKKYLGMEEEEAQNVVMQGRNEPCSIINVAHVVSKIKQIDQNQFVNTVFDNTLKMINE